jgi:hypothetical protein
MHVFLKQMWPKVRLHGWHLCRGWQYCVFICNEDGCGLQCICDEVGKWLLFIFDAIGSGAWPFDLLKIVKA